MIVNTQTKLTQKVQTKLTQKVNHFTKFKSFPSTSCCSQKLPPNNLGWLDV